MRYRLAFSMLFSAPLLAGSGCGGAETPAPKTVDDQVAVPDHPDRPTMSASAEIGALDEEKVTSTFQGAQGDLERCLSAGAQRNELEGGDIAFFVKIDDSGHILRAYAERSTIGDRKTEKCMLDALRQRTWPEPQGGTYGVAHNSFGFDMPNDERPPTAWAPSRVEETVGSLSSKLSACKRGARGTFTATVYVDPSGAAVTAGVASSDESGEKAVDCVVSVLEEAKYPSPGSWPAKVTFPL